MLYILLSYIYILFTTQNFGFIFYKLLKINASNFILKTIFGLFLVTILTTIWAVFGRINIEFHVLLFFLNIYIYYKFKNKIIFDYQVFFSTFMQFSKKLKIYFSIISVLILAQSSTAPYLPDNESYYIQTIKWLNEYGLVKGLVNLHIYLGQTSGWHICQSAFNFSFLYENFNDLSGFCLLLGNSFAIQKLDLYFKKANTNNLIIGLIPIFNLLFFRFISSPSPDIPIYIFSFIVFYLFIENYKETSIESFKIITIIVLFILFIKTTTAAIVLIPIVLFIKNFKKLVPNIITIIGLSFVVLSLYIIKNLIITGYPLYPIAIFKSQYYHTIPENMIFFFYNNTKLYAYFLTQQEFDAMSYFQIAKQWFSLSVIDSIFDFLTILTLIILPFFIYKFKNQKEFWILYFVLIIQMLLMFLTSPQYRFFIHFILFFDLFIFLIFCSNKNFILLLLNGSNIIIAFVLFLPIKFNILTTNDLISNNQNFKFENIIFPNENSNLKTEFQNLKKGNLYYNSPTNDSFFWGTGNANLPAINHRQLEYFEKYYFIIPQQRSNNLRDGFYCKKLNSSESKF